MFDISKFFGPEGPLSEHLPGYEVRQSQVRMAEVVKSSLTRGKNAAIEAPTGVGKSMGYLVPAISLKEEEDNPKTVIATANIVLQEQLIEKDLPFLKKVLPIDFKYALVKGKSNYLCQRVTERYMEGPDYDQLCHGLIKGNEKDQTAAIVKWKASTETGDKSELDFEPLPTVWQNFTCGYEECIGRACRSSKCFVKKARSSLKDADIIVCNYHLLLTDLQFDAGIFPSYEYLVCDEGHKIAKIARHFFGWELGEKSFRKIAKFVNGFKEIYHVGDRALDKALKEFNLEVTSSWKSISNFQGDNNSRRAFEVHSFSTNLPDMLDDLVENHLKLLLAKPSVTDEGNAELKKIIDRSIKFGRYLRDFLNLTDKDNSVYYVARNRGRLYLNMNKIDVSKYLKASLFDTLKSTIITSATLGINNSCTYVKEQIGLEADDYILPSPFDFSRQCSILASSAAPDPSDEEKYPANVAKCFAEIIENAKGRTLGLFTSYKNLKATNEYLKKHINGYNLLCQGDAPRMKLVDAFKKDVSSVLLGTDSFWAGVDIPGESLSCLVIDRLPFKSPGDPTWDALVDQYKQKGKNWFQGLAIPEAVIQFKQGVGRLIRSKTDRGVIVILDNRICTKGYGGQFLRSIPQMVWFQDLDFGHIERFLEEGTHEASRL